MQSYKILHFCFLLGYNGYLQVFRFYHTVNLYMVSPLCDAIRKSVVTAAIRWIFSFFFLFFPIPRSPLRPGSPSQFCTGWENRGSHPLHVPWWRSLASSSRTRGSSSFLWFFSLRQNNCRAEGGGDVFCGKSTFCDGNATKTKASDRR